MASGTAVQLPVATNLTRRGRRTFGSHPACENSQLLIKQYDIEKIALDASASQPQSFRLQRPHHHPHGHRMKSLRSAMAGVALPVALLAQQPQVNPITAAFKARIAANHRNIAQAFDSIPESKFGYKPTPAQLTFGFIAQHVASDSYLFCSNFGVMKPTIDAKDTSTPDSVKATWPKAELVSKLKASFAFCDQAIEQVTDATLPDAIAFTY